MKWGCLPACFATRRFSVGAPLPLRFPHLQRELQSKGVGKDAEWAAVLRQPLFAQASDGASLAHLFDLWVERQHLLWKVGRGNPRMLLHVLHL